MSVLTGGKRSHSAKLSSHSELSLSDRHLLSQVKSYCNHSKDKDATRFLLNRLGEENRLCLLFMILKSLTEIALHVLPGEIKLRYRRELMGDDLNFFIIYGRQVQGRAPLGKQREKKSVGESHLFIRSPP